MIEVKILKLTDHSATCEVVTDDGAQRFTVGAGSEAHSVLRLVVHNAARVIAERKTERLMRELASR